MHSIGYLCIEVWTKTWHFDFKSPLYSRHDPIYIGTRMGASGDYCLGTSPGRIGDMYNICY